MDLDVQASLYEGNEEEFSGSDPDLEAGLYLAKEDIALFFDDTYKGFANIEFELKPLNDHLIDLPNTVFYDARREGDILLIRNSIPFAIEKIRVFEQSKNISKILFERFNIRSIGKRYVKSSKFQISKSTPPNVKELSVDRGKSNISIQQQVLDLEKEIRNSSFSKKFYSDKKIKRLISQSKERFGQNFRDNPKYLEFWKKEWRDFENREREKFDKQSKERSRAKTLSSIELAYRAKGPAQKEMLRDLVKGDKVPTQRDRLNQYMKFLADKYLERTEIKRFADVTKGIRRLFVDLEEDGRLEIKKGYYTLRLKEK